MFLFGKMFLLENDMSLLGKAVFLPTSYMFLCGIHLLLLGNDMFLFVNSMLLVGTDMLLFGKLWIAKPVGVGAGSMGWRSVFSPAVW